jgi:hypothetical protein
MSRFLIFIFQYAQEKEHCFSILSHFMLINIAKKWKRLVMKDREKTSFSNGKCAPWCIINYTMIFIPCFFLQDETLQLRSNIKEVDPSNYVFKDFSSNFFFFFFTAIERRNSPLIEKIGWQGWTEN